jgi:hypothetical protein
MSRRVRWSPLGNAVKQMTPDNGKRTYRRDMLLASAMLFAGLMLCALSIAQIKAASGNQRVAQATQPMQSSPAQATSPAEAKPGGERPTTPAPEPARPDAEAQKAGATPALPPAPAEKTAPPIKDR